MTCAFYLESSLRVGPGCQFPENELVKLYNGQTWCRFHLPMKVQGKETAKALWDEPEIEAFNGAIFAFITEAATQGGADLSGVVFPGAISFHLTRRQLFKDTRFNGDATFLGTFNIDATFKGASFGGNATFRGNFLGATFEGARFGGNATFKGANFGDDATFEGAGFDRDATFEGASFQRNATFVGASFDRAATFEGASFDRDATFERARFGRNATFKGARFGDNATFEGASFGGDATFEGASFDRGATFEGASFDRDATFEGASFDRDATFKEVSFGGNAWFRESSFSRDLLFPGASFGGDASFSAARGEGNRAAVTFSTVNFTGAKFSGEIRFQNREFLDATNFHGAYFERAPKFHGCTLHQDTFFPRQTNFQDRSGAEAALAYRTLKHAMASVHARGEEAKFYALEQKSLLHDEDTPLSAKSFSVLYWLAADYGQSVLRPLFGILITSASFFAIYMTFLWFCLDPTSSFVYPAIEFGDVLRFSLRQVFRPFEVLSLRGAVPAEAVHEALLRPPLPLALLAALHSVLTLSFLALFLLALRRRFKLD